MMETNKILVQKIRQQLSDNYAIAERYYAILSAVNDLKLTQREIQLITFTAIRGNMSYSNIREDFCNRYNTSGPTINNIISKLKKLKVLVKDRGKIKVNPAILLNFSLNIVLQISILHE